MSGKVYSVLDFGATPNTDELQSKYIQKALDTCFLEGGGEVTIPTGAWHIGGLRLRSNTTLHLLEDCVLEASRDPEDYFILENDAVEPVDPSDISYDAWINCNDDPSFTFFNVLGNRWNNGIIRIFDAKNVTIIGEKGSIIDGKNCFDEKGEEHYRGPHGISIMRSSHIRMSGFTAWNTANWAINGNSSYDMRFDSITCNAGHDGIHITSCEDVIVKNCEFHTGDDCVAGFNNKNVLVSSCELNSACSAFRFGGTNVLVIDCKIYAPAKYLFRGGMTLEEKKADLLSNNAESSRLHKRDNMLSVFTYYCDYSVKMTNPASNIVIKDCTVDGADRFLHFNYSGNETWQKNMPMLDIKFVNIKAKNISMPLNAYGDAEMPLTLALENVEFSFRKGFENNAFIKTANYKEIRLENVKVDNCMAENLILSWSKPGDGKITVDRLDCGIPEDKLVGYPTEPFFTNAI